MPIISQDPLPTMLDDWEQFADELFNMFGNQHLQSTAQNALLNLKMKENTRVSEYLVAFNSHAPYTGWNDVALAGQFYRGLPDRLKDAFQLVGRPQTLAGMRQYALEFDQRYWERQAESGNRPVPAFRSRDKDNKKKPDQGSKSENQRSDSGNRSNNSANNNSQRSDGKKKPSDNSDRKETGSSDRKDSKPPAKESDGKTQPRGPLDAQEKERRKREGLCLYCGEKGHLVSECPKPRKSSRGATGRATYSFTPDDQSKNSSTTQESEEHS
jgi:hypothetical protein